MASIKDMLTVHIDLEYYEKKKSFSFIQT